MNIILQSLTYLEFNKVREEITRSDTLLTSGLWKRLLMYITISLVHPNPALEGINYRSYIHERKVTVERTINSLLCIFLLLRSYFIVRYFVYLSGYMSPKMNSICKKHFFETNTLFSIKVLIHKRPIYIYSLFFSIALYFFAFCIRVFEREISIYNNQDFNSFWNSAWYVLVTMTTVGFGDFVAESNEGRLFAVFACITGVFLISLMLLTLTNILNMNQDEGNAFYIIERIQLNKRLSLAASKVMQSFTRYYDVNAQDEKNLTGKFRSRRKVIDENVVDHLSCYIQSFQDADSLCNNQRGNESALTNVISDMNFLLREYELLLLEDDKNIRKSREIKRKLEDIYEMLMIKKGDNGKRGSESDEASSRQNVLNGINEIYNHESSTTQILFPKELSIDENVEVNKIRFASNMELSDSINDASVKVYPLLLNHDEPLDKQELVSYKNTDNNDD